MPQLSASFPSDRLQRIEQARQAVMHTDQHAPGSDLLPGLGVAPWIQRSWQRCLLQGRQPGQRVAFDSVSDASMRRTVEASRQLVQAAKPVLGKLGHAMANTRYFAILTNADGVVIDAHGPIDRSDRRADLITRIGVDLSERSVGTSAIGAALHELQPVWLHRGEHFFADTRVYSCAGAPLFGPDGRCVGMLDLTGVETMERPELMHLVAQSARSIEDALVLGMAWALLLRINWPGRSLGEASDGLVCLDADGWVLGLNHAAQQMLGTSAMRDATQTNSALHANDLLALDFEILFDAARAHRPCVEVPLWSGLRLNAQPLLQQQSARRYAPAAEAAAPSQRVPLKDIETSLIQQAVRDAKGNVAEAARALGISRATVYRKLAPAVRPRH